MQNLVSKKYINSCLSWFLAWLVPLFYFANLFRMLGNSPLPYIVTLIGCGTVGLFILSFCHIRKNSILWAMLAILFFTGGANYLIVNSIDFGDIVSNILYVGVMAVMLAYPMTYLQGFVTFYISILIFISAFFSGAKTWELLTSSGNYISVLMILAASLYYITIQYNKRELTLIDLVPSLLCFLLSVWAKGRGGIVCSALLLLLMIFHYLRNYVKKDSRRYGLIIVMITVFVICLITLEFNPLDAFMRLGKLSSRGFDNGPRERIWDAYFGEINENIAYSFIGAPLRDIPIIHHIGDNTHNSFLHLHATNGIIPFVLFWFLFIRAMISHLKKQKALFMIVLFVITVRGMTDKFIFGQYGMPIVMYLVLYPYFDSYISAQIAKE